MKQWNNNLEWPWVFRIFTLPMRNWNTSGFTANGMGYLNFYSTYEELKQPKYCLISCSVNIIFTLPMRNWNMHRKKQATLFCPYFYSTYEELKLLIAIPTSLYLCAFLLYLWGIETSAINLLLCVSFAYFYSTYEELKHSQQEKWSAWRKKFLLYLWGIETIL